MRTLFSSGTPDSARQLFVGLLAMCSIAVHPFILWSDETVEGQALSASDLNVSPQIGDRAETFLHGLPFEPNSVAMVQLCGPYVLAGERDLRRARDHMNLSERHQYSLNQQEKLLANIASPSKPMRYHCSSTR
jgi:hypothetical protein